MRIIDRYKRLSFWNRLAVWGSVASILGLLVVVVPGILREFGPASRSGPSPTSAAPDAFVSPAANGPIPSDLDPISPDQVLETLAEQRLTELQKAEFRRVHAARTVRWSGYVQTVAPLWEAQPDSPIIVLVVPEGQKGNTFPELIPVLFPPAARVDLSRLQHDSWVEFQGVLDFEWQGQGTEPRIKDAVLLRFR